MNPEPRMITVPNVTPIVFNQLDREHMEGLSCPCSALNVPLKDFVVHNITFHPVCSSKTTIRANHFVSALNTNYLTTIIHFQFTHTLVSVETSYTEFSIVSSKKETMSCTNTNPTTMVGFSKLSNIESHGERLEWSKPRPNAILVNGFFTGCTPLEAILRSTLDCLYSIECLQIPINKFPGIKQTQMNWTDYVLSSTPQNISLDVIQKIAIEFTVLVRYIDERTEIQIKHQKIITRVYMVLLIGLFLILLLLISLNTEIITKTIKRPTLIVYKDLHDQYSNTLIYPCSYMMIPYNKFVSLSPILHQVCSSDLITDKWISLLNDVRTEYNSPDWRNKAPLKFQLLSDLCNLAKKTIDDAIHRFLSQSFITLNALSQIDFDTQLNATLKQFIRSTTDYFDLLIQTSQILVQVDQPYFVTVGAKFARNREKNLRGKFVYNGMGQRKYQVAFQLLEPIDIASSRFNCICATDSQCQTPMTIHRTDTGLLFVPGWIIGCSATDSLMRSTLECYYSSSDCLSILMNYINRLVYNSTLSRFPPKTLISNIIQNIMIEQWNSSVSYNRFYESCAPSYYSYSLRMPAKSTVEIITTLLSSIGGLILLLRLVIPQLVNSVINLNIFLLRDFGSNTDRTLAKRLGQWATRLYMILFSIGIVTLTLRAIVQPQTMKKTFDKPSLVLYNQLYQHY
ncbi:hypothetical protein I4U23_016873 [Adineta vaga]|nr:hypothetical protein I4U23_016873 [Adineta vaga]